MRSVCTWLVWYVCGGCVCVCGVCGGVLFVCGSLWVWCVCVGFLLFPVLKSSGIHLRSNRFGRKSVHYRSEMWPKWETDSCVRRDLIKKTALAAPQLLTVCSVVQQLKCSPF